MYIETKDTISLGYLHLLCERYNLEFKGII